MAAELIFGEWPLPPEWLRNEVRMDDIWDGPEAALDLAGGTAVLGGRPRSLTLEEQIAALFQQLRDPIYRYVLSILRDPAEAEEIAQDTFLRLHLHLKAGRRIDCIKPWLFRVAHNLAIDCCRMQSRSAIFGDDEPDALGQVPRDPTLSPEDALLRQEMRATLHRAISRLARQQQRCLHLRAEGLRYREIAAVLGISDSTVAECLRRGLARLVKELNE